MARLGLVLIVVGLASVVYGVAWQMGWAPGSRLALPAPVALARPTPTAVPLPIAGTPPLVVTPTPMPIPTAAPRSAATPAPMRLVPADVAERPGERYAGYAVRLAIPSIKLDTEVRQGGIVPDATGQPIWQTLPFVAVHYGDLTSLIGARGNAVIAGHVVTLSEGNVFRFLYQLDFGDEVQVWDDAQHEHDYSVVDVKLVPPADTSVMAATSDERLTLITCGGTFDPVKREFSDRLIVTAKPAQIN